MPSGNARLIDPAEESPSIYSKITAFLRRHTGERLEIEMFTPEIKLGVLEDGLSFGITKKALVNAFLVARRLFFDASASPPTQHIGPLAILDASAVILLLNPEHTTAANYRKRQLLRLRDSTQLIVEEDCARIVKEELALLASFVTSPLHRHTKSPTLWHHRLWIAKEFFSVFNLVHNARDDWGVAYASELMIVMLAGEQHPRNYYAWNYARGLFHVLQRRSQLSVQCDVLGRIIAASIQTMHAWCLKHADDTSGWSFLLFIMSQSTDHRFHHKVALTTFNIAISFGWSHESLWVFLRTLLASSTYITTPERKAFLVDLLGELGSSVSADVSTGQTCNKGAKQGDLAETVRRAIRWIESNWVDERLSSTKITSFAEHRQSTTAC